MNLFQKVNIDIANALFIKDNVDLKIKKDSDSKIYFYNIGTKKAEIIHKKK